MDKYNGLLDQKLDLSRKLEIEKEDFEEIKHKLGEQDHDIKVLKTEIEHRT